MWPAVWKQERSPSLFLHNSASFLSFEPISKSVVSPFEMLAPLHSCRAVLLPPSSALGQSPDVSLCHQTVHTSAWSASQAVCMNVNTWILNKGEVPNALAPLLKSVFPLKSEIDRDE